MIRALVFDFDGLILDTETPLIEAWEQVHIQAGIPCPRAQALELIGKVDHDYDLWQAFGARANRDALERKFRQLKHALLEAQDVLPGVRERLNEARQLGLERFK